MFSNSKRLLLLGLSVFLFAFPFTSMASTSKEIDSISIHTISVVMDDSDIDVDIITDSNKYYVDKVSVIYVSDDRRFDEDQPILKVYLKANDGYKFAYEISDKSTFTGMGGSIMSGGFNDKQLISYFILNVQNDDGYYDINPRNLDIGNLILDEDGIASWNGDADKYQVKLYRGGRLIKTLNTELNSYDFSDYLTASGYYRFQARADVDSHKGNWKKSTTLHVTPDEVVENSSVKLVDKEIGPGISTGTWLKDNTGWLYCKVDGSNVVSDWQYMNDKWYYFNESGYMVTGWINWKSKWYYCGDDGAMETNTKTPDGYQVGYDGAWTGK